MTGNRLRTALLAGASLGAMLAAPQAFAQAQTLQRIAAIGRALPDRFDQLISHAWLGFGPFAHDIKDLSKLGTTVNGVPGVPPCPGDVIFVTPR